MNLVAVLIAPSVVKYHIGAHANTALRLTVSLVAVAILVLAVVVAKRRQVPNATSAGSSEPAAVVSV